jgi:hypothetical protein
MMTRRLLVCALPPLTAGLVWLAGQANAAHQETAKPVPTSRLVYPGKDGRLVYRPYNERGDTIPDFSHCGYGGGGVALPVAPVKVTLSPEAGDGDDLPRIQKAVDAVSSLPPGKDGLRGAVLLRRGRYRVGGTLRIAASGVVLRGEGKTPETGTFVLATAKAAEPLVEVRGAKGLTTHSEKAVKITDGYVPVGARSFRVASAAGLRVGDPVLVRRHGNADWIRAIGMDRITPRASDPSSTKQWAPFSLGFDRVITRVEGDRVTMDAPLACAIDSKWGGGDVVPCEDARIERVGVENLYVESAYDASKTSTVGADDRKPYPADEEHATYIVTFGNVRNAWARDLTARYLAHGVATLERGAKWVTVQDSSAVDPVSIITGGRRYPFNISGQLCLVQRCYARDARHAFVVGGGQIAGPNVFLDCKAEANHATSEPHQRWSVGGLYDNVSATMAIQDRQWMGSGHGWAGANYVVWNSTGSLVCQQPPTAQNFAIGFVGKKEPGAFERPQGWWESYGTHVGPRSLYLAQLQDRVGKPALPRAAVAP